MKLNEIRDNEGATKNRIRIGRGIGSGKGKTGGRGGKGQTARSGVALNGFEGGQMPLHMRIPKRGFNNPSRLRFSVVNLWQIQGAIDSGRLSAGELIDQAKLESVGILKNVRDGIRLLGTGELKSAVKLSVNGASKSAIEAVQKSGGEVTVVAV
ncbi:MAG: 50S ribosomal protein L15 [Alphaproteobacteria bacterium]